jgi:hypothetical protein
VVNRYAGPSVNSAPVLVSSLLFEAGRSGTRALWLAMPMGHVVPVRHTVTAVAECREDQLATRDRSTGSVGPAITRVHGRGATTVWGGDVATLAAACAVTPRPVR